MQVNPVAIYRLIGEMYRGNLSAFARAIAIDRVVVWRVLNGKSKGTSKFVPAFYAFCKRESLNPDMYFSIIS